MATSDSFPIIVVILFCFFYASVFISSTVGNAWVVITCYKTLKRTHFRLMWLVANLATTDLLFTFLTLFNAVSFLWRWIGGNATCKVQGFIIETSYTVSITTLVLISYERLKAITDPFGARMRNRSDKVHVKLIIIWVTCLAVCSPLLHLYRVETTPTGETACMNKTWDNTPRQVFYSLHAIIFFLAPLCYMIFTQRKIFRTLRSAVLPIGNSVSASNRKHKAVAKTLAAITVAFVVCWSPFVVTRTLMYFHVVKDGLIWRSSQLLICLNATLDPLLYGYYGGNLKLKLRKFCTLCKRRSLQANEVVTFSKEETNSVTQCQRR